MLFGLALPADASPERIRSLLAEGRALVEAWGRSLDDDASETLLMQFNDEALRSAGLRLERPPAPTPVSQVRCTFDVELRRVSMGDEHQVTDPAVLNVFDGLTPSDDAFEYLEDLPGLADVDWVLDARVQLRFDAVRVALVCDLDFSADREVDAALLKEARAIGPRLWKSGWSLNLEWPHRDAPGFDDSHWATFLVEAIPREVLIR